MHEAIVDGKDKLYRERNVVHDEKAQALCPAAPFPGARTRSAGDIQRRPCGHHLVYLCGGVRVMEMGSPDPDETLDLSGVPCPHKTERALVKLEIMEPGEVLEIIIDAGEPVEKIAQSLVEGGHGLIAKSEQGDKWRMVVRRVQDG